MNKYQIRFPAHDELGKSCLSRAICLAHLHKVYQSNSFDDLHGHPETLNTVVQILV